MTASWPPDNGGGLVGFRLAIRLARREIVRRPGRTLLVALLVALPVAGMTVAAVAVRTQHETAAQLWEQQNGQADAYTSKLFAQLPEHREVRSPAYGESRVLRTVNLRRSQVSVSIIDMTDPITHGILQVMSGHVPTGANQVFLTRDAAHELGVKAGGTLRLVRPASVSLEVTGVGEFSDAYGGARMVLPLGVPYPWKSTQKPQSGGYLVKFAHRPSRAVLNRLIAFQASSTSGLQISPALITTPGYDTGQSDAAKKVAWSWVIGALVMTVVGIVIAAAFAVGARRQLVTLGQLAGNGASPKVLRRVLFLQGTLTGVVGTVGGLGLGALALALLAPHADQVFRRDVHPYIVRPTDVVPIVLLGIITATIAALVPARAISRIPVLSALSGRRPLGEVPRWLPVTGAFVSAGGLGLLALSVLGADGNGARPTVWVLTAMAGSVAVLLGACAIAPWYVSILEPAAARTRGSWRVATRSLARQRTRTSSVVSAIAATGALVIAASSLLLAAHAHDANFDARDVLPANEVLLSGNCCAAGNGAPPATFVADVENVLPHAKAYQLRTPYRANTTLDFTGFTLDKAPKSSTGGPQFVQLPSGMAISNDPALNLGQYATVAIADRASITAYKLSASDQRTLATHGAIVLGDASGHAGLKLETHVGKGVVAPRPQTFSAPIVDARHYRLAQLPSVLVTEAKAAELGMTTRASALVLFARRALTVDQRDQIADIATDAQDALPPNSESAVNYSYQYPSTAVDPLLLEWLLVAVALVLTLFVVAVNLALSAAETRDERDVLTIVGAAPRTISRTNGYKAALLTSMGSLLAIPVGLMPVAVFIAARNDGTAFAYPIWVIALLVVALPLAAGAVTAAGSAIALRVRPVRISTMAFD